MQQRILKNRYWLQELLGEGGMGRVYRAVDTRTRASVAVKLLSDSSRGNSKLLRALWREVRAVARMAHRNVVQVVDYGQSDDDNPFFVMEYVPGKSLDAWRGHISIRDLYEVADGILAALAYAHARGVVHRDLKPDNVMVVEQRDGGLLPKLVDFGVAMVGGLRIDPTATGDNRALADAIVGTPAYMSPEQAQGLMREIGAESDLYAFGVMMYEFISGELPFSAANPMSLLMHHVHTAPPPLVTPPGTLIPDGLGALIMELLAKEPRQRPPFAADVRRRWRALDWSRASEMPTGFMATGDHPSISLDGDAIVVNHAQAGTPQPSAHHAAAPDTGQPWLHASSGEPDDLARRHTVDAGTLPLTPLPRTEACAHGTSAAAQDEPEEHLVTMFGGDGGGGLETLPLMPGLFGIREVPFVGRAAEREELWGVFEHALKERNIRFVFLRGARGVGKSRLARWLSERAEEEGLAQTLGCGIGAGAVLPAGGIRTIIERHLRIHDLERRECERILMRVLVDEGHFQPEEIGPILDYLRPRSDDASPDGARAVEPAALAARVLRLAITRRPVILWLDDLAGPDTGPIIDLLELLQAMRNLSPMPILAVVTQPDGRAPSDEGSGAFRPPITPRDRERIDDLIDSSTTTILSLEHMPTADCAKLATAMLPVTDDLALMVASRSGGNPLYAIQILSHWMNEDSLVESEDGLLALSDMSLRLRRLPGGIAELIRSRLGAVLLKSADTAATRAILGRAALVGRRFTLVLLEHLVEREARPELVPQIDEVAQRMIDEELWIELEGGLLQFASADVHEQVREHLVPATDAVRINGLLAEIKSDLYRKDLAHRHGEIALHLEAAGMYEQAARNMLAAGRQGLVWAQYDVAQEWFRHARSLLDHHAIRGATELADALDLSLARCAFFISDYDDAERHLDAIDERLRGAARQRSLAMAILLRAEISHKRGQLDNATDRFLLARERFEAFGDDHGIARSLLGLAEVFVSQGVPERIANNAGAARAVFARLGDSLEEARCRMNEGKAARLTGDLDAARAHYEAARVAAEAAGARHRSLEVQTLLCDVLLAQGALHEASVRYRELLQPLVEIGDLWSTIVCYRGLGAACRKLGRLKESEASYQRALELAQTIGDSLAVARAYNGLGEVARHQQQWDAALRHYRGYVDAARQCGATASVAFGEANIGLIHLEQGAWTEARDQFARATEVARTLGREHLVGAFLGSLARANAELGAWSEVERSLGEALAIHGRSAIDDIDFLKALQQLAERAWGPRQDLSRQAALPVYTYAQQQGDRALLDWASLFLD